MIYETNRCSLCEYYDVCEYAEQINFCDDCKYGTDCDMRTVQCLAGHDIECNNTFEPKSEIDWEEEENEEGQ